VDVITFEFENIPTESLVFLETQNAVFPNPSVLHICRHRAREKAFIQSCGIATASYQEANDHGLLKEAADALGLPAILKTSELGYDGKGQILLQYPDDLKSAWEKLAPAALILESFVDFAMEISVLVARDAHGNMACYDPVQNIHEHHMLARTIAPAPINTEIAEEACVIARRLAERLDLRGLLAVELFVTKEGRLLVNELAPRPHNSGHWTIEACITSQFEQQIRAICGLPLGSAQRLCDAVMLNLIGDQTENWRDYLREPSAKLHLYGKNEMRPGRKMGHVTFLQTEKRAFLAKNGEASQ
jgi:5-(carboxyamino)imidazole ribonucleotide synthase